MRYALLAAAAVCGGALAMRGLIGPFAAVHSPMNVEGILALSLIALLLLRDVPSTDAPARFSLPLTALICLAVGAGFALYLDFPLLADDYSHIWNAHHASGGALLAHFTVPEEDHFFRPFTYLSYALDATWAGYYPAAWRIGNLLLHLTNCVLVFRLCHELGFRSVGAWGGALVFGLHGSGPEVVTWIAARFDLLAVLFGLCCILSFLRGSRLWLTLIFLLADLLSKESAYIIPLVLTVMLFYCEQTWRRIAAGLWPLLTLEALVFAYRTWLLNGIGGYRNAATGRPAILHFGLASTLKALFLRFWAAMMFPLNWTGGLLPVVAVGLAIAIAAVIYLAWRGADRRKAMLGLAVATLCSLPVQQFLSIGPDLEKSRVLYMPSIGLAILIAAAFENTAWPIAAVVFFQFAALESNLSVWKRTGYTAERACRAGADALRSDARPLAAIGLPNVLDGVYFLHTGYPECVQFQLPESAGRVFIQAQPGAQEIFWNETRKILERR